MRDLSHCNDCSNNEYNREFLTEGGILKKAVVTTAIMAVAAAAVILLLSAGVRIYTDAAEYSSNGGEMLFEIPDDACNKRFVIRKNGISRFYGYSFETDEKTADEYIRSLSEKYGIYSQETEDTMYGYAHWYGMKVSECDDAHGVGNAFPTALPFNEITAAPIEDYTLIVYSPKGTGGSSYGVLLSPDEKSFVCYSFYSK